MWTFCKLSARKKKKNDLPYSSHVQMEMSQKGPHFRYTCNKDRYEYYTMNKIEKYE